MGNRDVYLSVAAFARALCEGSSDPWACAVVLFSKVDRGVSECTHL